MSPAWSVEKKQQETCVQVAVFKEYLRGNSYPVMQSKQLSSSSLPFPLLSAPLCSHSHSCSLSSICMAFQEPQFLVLQESFKFTFF